MALAAILDRLTHLASILCWYRSDCRQHEFRQAKAALLRNSKVRGYEHVCDWWSAKKPTNLGYKATKHVERTFLISDYC